MLLQLLQQQEEPRGNRVRYIAGILIMIGLLGTFLDLFKQSNIYSIFLQQQKVLISRRYSPI